MKCNKEINNNLKRIFCNLVFKNNKYKKGIIIILGLVFINCCDYEKIINSTKEANKEENKSTKKGENNGSEIELGNVKSINGEENEKKEDQASEIIENEGMFSNTINDSFLKEERCSYCQSCLKKKKRIPLLLFSMFIKFFRSNYCWVNYIFFMQKKIIREF